MPRRGLRVALCLGLVPLLGCGDDVTTKPQQQTLPEVHLLMYLRQDAVENVVAIANSSEFRQQYPNVSLDVQAYGDWSTSTGRVLDCLENETCGDIEFIESAGWWTLHSGTFIDLRPYGIDINDYNDHHKMVALGQNGELLGVPFDSPPALMYYRMDVAKQVLQKMREGAPVTDEDVINYMDHVTWDKLVTQFAPVAFQDTDDPQKDASKLNQGYRLYLLHRVGDEPNQIESQTVADWERNGTLNPDLIPYLKKHMKIQQALMRGKGTGEPPADAAAKVLARSQSYVADARDSDLFSGADRVNLGTAQNLGMAAVLVGGLFYGRQIAGTQPVWAKPWGIDYSTAMNPPFTKAEIEANTDKAREERILYRYVSYTDPKAPQWGEQLWHVAPAPTVEPEYGIPAGTQLYTIHGGTYFGVTKACDQRKDPSGRPYDCAEWAAKVVKFLTQAKAAQLEWWNVRYAFPATKDRSNLPPESEERFFHNSPIPVAAQAVDNMNKPGVRRIGYSRCNRTISSFYTAEVNKYLTFDPDPKDPLVADLRESSLGPIQDAVLAALKAEIEHLAAHQEECQY